MNNTNPDKLYCHDHPTGVVGVDQYGNYYPTCAAGRRLGFDKCDLRKAEGGESMEDQDQEWIKGNVADTEDVDVEFEATFFLSTDGKMTVSTKSSTQEGRKAAAAYVVKAYDKLIQRYGTKQSQAVREYAKTPEEASLGVCKDCGAAMKMSSKGKPYCSDKCWLKK